MKERILKVGKNTILALSIVLAGFLFLLSQISTAYFISETQYWENPSYRMDNILLNLLALLVPVFCVLFAWRKLGGRIRDKERFLRRLSAAAVLFTVALSIFWVRISYTYPMADQKGVSEIAYRLTVDDFQDFEHGKYMQFYPNQLGLAALLEVLYRLTGGENWDAFRYLTALANGAVVYLLYKITDRLFHSKKADCIVLLLCISCAQIVLYTTFLYGITLGLMCALAAFYFQLLFLEEKKLWQAVLSSVLIGAAILIKNNYSIFLVAMVLLAVYKALEQKSFRQAALALSLVLAFGLMNKALTTFYEARSGIDLGPGMPKTLWIAMGMQEGMRAEGWYNEFNFNTFMELDCDVEESDLVARNTIGLSLKVFRENPAYALEFYYKKTASQWNEPTYESQWVNQFHQGKFSVVVQSIYDGKLYTVLREYMNLYQQLIFAAAFFCLLARRRQWKAEQLFLFLVILGGFIFHTIWEAKSQYIFPYFVIFLPYGAVGLTKAAEIAGRRFARKQQAG